MTCTATFTTHLQSFPAGTVGGNYLVAILDSIGNAVVTMDATESPAVFSAAIAPGTYTATIQLLDSDRHPLTTPITSEPFTIPPDEVQLLVPSTITITLS